MGFCFQRRFSFEIEGLWEASSSLLWLSLSTPRKHNRRRETSIGAHSEIDEDHIYGLGWVLLPSFLRFRPIQLVKCALLGLHCINFTSIHSSDEAQVWFNYKFQAFRCLIPPLSNLLITRPSVASLSSPLHLQLPCNFAHFLLKRFFWVLILCL